MTTRAHPPANRPTYVNLETGERREVVRNSEEHVALVRERYKGQSHAPLWEQFHHHNIQTTQIGHEHD